MKSKTLVDTSLFIFTMYSVSLMYDNIVSLIYPFRRNDAFSVNAYYDHTLAQHHQGTFNLSKGSWDFFSSSIHTQVVCPMSRGIVKKFKEIIFKLEMPQNIFSRNVMHINIVFSLIHGARREFLKYFVFI